MVQRGLVTGKPGSLIRRFVVFYIGFALIPFGLLFYLFLRHGSGEYLIAVSRTNLGVLILLVGVACLLGFFAMSSTLGKIMRLTQSIRKSVTGQADKAFIATMMNEEGEVAELAKSFNAIVSNLESNISELERTKDTLHQVVSKVGSALASMEDIGSLMTLTLETAIEALGASDGAICSLDPEGAFKVEACVTSKEMGKSEILDLISTHLDGVASEGRMSLLPVLEGEAGSSTPFSAPVICCPLTYRGVLRGAICLAGKKRGGSFDDDEMKIMQNLSSQIALSFENIRLNQDRERVYFETITALAMAVEARDPYSRGHSERVGEVSVKIAESMGLPPEDIQSLRDAAKLHDIGKIGITDSILQKDAEPLSVDEMAIMRQHPVIGENIVAPLKTFSHLMDPVRHHHERLDGSGYPDGISGDAIHLSTRIIMVADIYDAMAKDRPYRPALGEEKTRAEINKLAGEGKLDPRVVDHFNRLSQDMVA